MKVRMRPGRLGNLNDGKVLSLNKGDHPRSPTVARVTLGMPRV